jgi:hypothetical protein
MLDSNNRTLRGAPIEPLSQTQGLGGILVNKYLHSFTNNYKLLLLFYFLGFCSVLKEKS